MNYITELKQHPTQTLHESRPQEHDGLDLFAEELPTQQDLTAPHIPTSTIMCGSCAGSCVGTVSTVSSL